MELALLFLLFIPFLVLRYYLSDHDTPAEKDFKRFREGIALFQNHDFLQAFRYFDEQLKSNPKSSVAIYFRGKCSFAEKNYYSALYDFSQALSFDNTRPEFYIAKGKVHLVLEEYSKAFKEFDKAVWYSHNENPDALRLRGQARIYLKQNREAVQDFRQAIELGDEESAFLLRQFPLYRK
jgi:tetratricopeptide (TPR) repeat protein